MNITYALVDDVDNDNGELDFQCSKCGHLCDGYFDSLIFTSIALRHHRANHEGHIAWLLLTPGTRGYLGLKMPVVRTDLGGLTKAPIVRVEV